MQKFPQKNVLLSLVLVVVGGAAFAFYFSSISAHEVLSFDSSLHELPIAETTTDDGEPVRWPNLFGPEFDNSSTARINLNWDECGPDVLWDIEVGTGYSSPVVWDDRVIITHRIGDHELVSCVNAKDGSLLWEHKSPTDFVCNAKYTNGPYSTPIIDGESVYMISAAGVLRCLRFSDGGELWQCDFQAKFGYEQRYYGAGQGLLLWNGLLIVNVGGTFGESGIVAFHQRTGEIIWKTTNHGAGYTTPRVARIHDRDYLFVTTYDGIVALNPKTGEVYWDKAWRSPISFGENAVTPVIDGDKVLFCSYGNGTLATQIQPDGSYKTLWDGNRALTSQFTPVVCHKGYVYGVHCADHTLRCIEFDTGQLQWRKRTDLKRATMIHLQDKLILFGEFGHLACLQLDPKKCEFVTMTAESLFDETFCFSSPALANGRLYLRNEKKLICLDVSLDSNHESHPN